VVFLDEQGASIALSSIAATSAAASNAAASTAGRSGLLVLRVVAGWCGTCRWSAANTRSLVAPERLERTQFVDVLLAGDDNGPPQARDSAAWKARSDGLARVVIDSEFQLRELFSERSALPLLALVDADTLSVRTTLSNPAPEELRAAIDAAFGAIDGDAPTAPAPPPPVDGRFTRDQWDMIAAMRLDAGPAPDPTNRHADDARAAALGRELFFDGELSPTGVSCSRCHLPELGFQDGRETPAQGVRRLDRNAPSTLLAGYADTQLWDGRADSLWMQALAPIESPDEFGSSRVFAVRALFRKYRADYEAVFGALPPLDDERFPAQGGPGDAAWEGLTAVDRDAVSRAFVNLGKAIAAFERSQRPMPDALDAYAGGRLDAFDDVQKDGLAAFFEAGCAQCHYGPLLTDGSFHNLRFPTGRHDRAADRGRMDGIARLLGSEFNRGGAFSDDPSAYVQPEASQRSLGAFKTPSLRGVGYTLPYGHGGSYWGLASVIEAIRTGGLPAESPYATGELEPFLPEFDEALTSPLIAFLSALKLDVQDTISKTPPAP
jgi:cytochrome c peroxidase